MGVNDTLSKAASDRPEISGLRLLPLLAFDEGDERPDAREADLLDRDGCEIRLREEARQIEIGLEPDVHGEWRDGAFDSCEQRIGAAEMIENDDLATGPADAAHFADDFNGIRHDADHVRRIDDV